MATLYAKAAGGNWTAAATWSNVNSAGGDSSGPPTNADDVIFDSGSTGTVTVNNTSCVCKGLTCQSASNVIAFGTGRLSFYGNAVFYAGMTVTGTTGLLRPYANTLTLTTNGVAIPNFEMIGNDLTLGSALVITGTFTRFASSSISGAYDITCGNLILSGVLTIPAGQTLTVQNSIITTWYTVYTMQSATATAAIYLIYQGTAANCKVFNTTFTDVDASGSAQVIDNWYGGTLTRCTNIVNKTSADLARSTDAAKILSGQTVGGISGTASAGGAINLDKMGAM